MQKTAFGNRLYCLRGVSIGRGNTRCLTKLLSVMRLTVLFLTVACLHVNATGISQTVSFSERNSKITSVFAAIQEQTDFVVSYNTDLLQYCRPVNIRATNMPLVDFLDAALEDQPLKYEIRRKSIIISRGITPEGPSEDLPDTVQQALPPVSGVVRGEDGEPLSGVNVVIKEKGIGTITDERGRYEIDAPADAVLVFSYVGYETREELVGNRSSISLTMKAVLTDMDDVVVIGYGTKTKATLTGSVSTIDAAQLVERPVANTTDLLQGLAPGLQITRANSGRVADQGTGISIRGVTSRTDPGVLIVIDGIPQKDNNTYALDNINPNDIESISILKDAQAAIYGARAAGGVILVTTKKGRTTKPTINLSSTYTSQRPGLVRDAVNILQLTEMMDEAFTNDGQVINMYSHISEYIRQNDLTMDKISRNDGQYTTKWPFDNSANFVFGDYNWSEIMFEPAPLQVHNISVSGRSEKVNYYNSVGIVDQQSMLAYGDNYNKKYFVRLKYDYDVASFLKLSANMSFENQKTAEPYNYSGGLEFWQGLIWPVFMPYTPGGHLYNFGSHQNPIGYAGLSGYNKDQNYRLKSQLGMIITPFKGLTITGDFSGDFDINETDWSNIGFDMYDENDKFSYNSTNNRNSAGASYGRSKYLVANLFANYKFTLGQGHDFDIMAGTSHEEQDYRIFSAHRNLGLITAGLPTFGLGSADEQYNSESKLDNAINAYFSRIGYNFSGKYLLEGTFRYDGSSRFAKGYQWKPFYGLSAGWVLTRENFMQHISGVLNYMKMRVSWGQMGNQASIGNYDFISQINIGGSYPMGAAGSPTQTQSATLASLPSNIRTWETVETKNIGVDFSLLRSRLSGSFDYYLKDVANMFYTKEFPQVLGTSAPSINGAHVRTAGWDAEINWKDRVGAFGYGLGFNLSNNNSRVVDLADSRIVVHGYNGFVQGQPVGAYFGYVFDGFIQDADDLSGYNAGFSSGIPNNLKPGNVKYKDLNGDGKLTPQLYELGDDGKPTATSGDLQYIGDAGQHYLFGINMELSWKNFDLRAFFQGVMRWNVFEENRAFIYDSWPPQPYFYHNTWTPSRTTAVYPRLSADQGVLGYDYTVSDAPFKYFNNSYIRLKNLQIGYSVPASLIERYRLQQLRVYFTGADLYELYNIPGVYDPEKPFNYRITPIPRRFTFGVNITL